MTLPLQLHISNSWDLTASPIPELASLRDNKVVVPPAKLDQPIDLSRLVSGDQLEIELDLKPGDASRVDLKLRANSDFSRALVVSYDAVKREISVPGRSAARIAGMGDDLKLHIFLDKTVIDLFADNGSISLTGCASSERNDQGIGISAQYPNGSKSMAEIKSMTIYTLKPANLDLAVP
jgi:sucrose-6-phosphate hydrolase SacC (GH32 family)